MQINTQNYQYQMFANKANQETTQKQEEAKNFGEYLGIVVPTDEKLEQWEKNKQNAENLTEDSTPTLDRKSRLLAIGAKFINDIDEAMRIQGISDVSKLDSRILNQVRTKNSLESDSTKIQELLEQNIAILQNNRIQNGYLHEGKYESQAHFEERKNKTIDILSEILQNIKA
ncbi:hypothetical protein LS70_003240 [Helicobacter sp. MIT 11-5569]|uniref:hypothetical protein n=1 Tax=Helicobacter sp. MIT 11-5569 TaxID=1548151 RepID=UPI00051F9E82|nr:hypothetical protein [Helicobacter sp. MIT 11-5569]TLD84575.1 hypothetical protein LS70_003240 [Helicobacter sp. MIT 11-5569]